jgi:ribosomal protein S18 acetylase RimI-like enzyme
VGVCHFVSEDQTTWLCAPAYRLRDCGLPVRGGRPPECDRTIPVDSEPARIRPYQPDDLDELYRVCVQTADNGQDATSMFRDPRLPGHVYAAPYALFEPSLAFVAQDAGGVGGYVVAALDSQAFEQRLERDWWPALRASHPEPSQDLAAGLSRPEQFALRAIHHPWGTPDELARGFPSHLHINLIRRLQGQRMGRQLIATVISALRDQDSHGVHLHVGHGNQRAAGFYRHIGFAELPADDVHVFAMNLVHLAE